MRTNEKTDIHAFWLLTLRISGRHSMLGFISSRVGAGWGMGAEEQGWRVAFAVNAQLPPEHTGMGTVLLELYRNA